MFTIQFKSSLVVDCNLERSFADPSLSFPHTEKTKKTKHWLIAEIGLESATEMSKKLCKIPKNMIPTFLKGIFQNVKFVKVVEGSKNIICDCFSITEIEES